MKKILILVCLILSVSLFADEKEDGKSTASRKESSHKEKVIKDDEAIFELFDEKVAKELLEKKHIASTKYRERDMSTKLLPSSDLAKKISEVAASKSKKRTPAFLTEQLYLYEKGGEESVDISKILRSISSLKGTEYFSHSSQAMKPLYVEAYAVKEVKNGKKIEYEKIPDPVEGDADGLTILTKQSDLTFGDHIYRYQYFSKGNASGAVCTNVDTFKKSIFTVLSPEDLCIQITVQDIGSHLVVYCSTIANFARVPGIKDKVINAFSSRAEALYKWFIKEYEKASK